MGNDVYTKRGFDGIFANLNSLVKTPGYIYGFCLILFNDFHVELEKLHKVDSLERISVKEASLILGLLLKNGIDFSYPSSPECLYDMKERTYSLLSELHVAFSTPSKEVLDFMQSGVKKSDELLNISKHDFFVKSGFINEAIFYCGDGAYDVQYLDYLGKKYGLDAEWLSENRCFDISECVEIVIAIRGLLQEKSKRVRFVDLHDDENIDFFKSNLKGRNKERKFKEMLFLCELMQYNDLFRPIDGYEKLSRNEKRDMMQAHWNDFCDNLLDLFVFERVQLSHFVGINAFLDNFSVDCSSVVNEEFNGVGDYNIINSRPLIRIADDKYFLPLYYLLPQAVYESPYYWMCDDNNYRAKAFHNRGQTGENLVCELVKPVFGSDNVYPAVKIKTSKGNTITDIDVLCILGNKALCIQVKSKKLTLAARRGDTDALLKDFKGAFQDAYEQGVLCRRYIMNGGCTFYDKENNILDIAGRINDVYIIGVTTENFPAITPNAYVFLDKRENDLNPLLLSVFDLELLAHYLNNPYDFMYYVRQRTTLMDFFIASEEIVYLGYHLMCKLWMPSEYDFVSLNNDYGSIVDRNYYPYRLGMHYKISSEGDAIAHKWKNEDFNKLCRELDDTGDCNAVDIIFALMDLDSPSIDNLFKLIEQTKEKTRCDYGVHSFSMPVGKEFGISFTSIGNMSKDELEKRTVTYSHIRKYICHADSWLGMGSFLYSPQIVDCFYYDRNPWVYNSDDEKMCQDFMSRVNSKTIPLRKQDRK